MRLHSIKVTPGGGGAGAKLHPVVLLKVFNPHTFISFFMLSLFSREGSLRSLGPENNYGTVSENRKKTGVINMLNGCVGLSSFVNETRGNLRLINEYEAVGKLEVLGVPSCPGVRMQHLYNSFPPGRYTYLF